MRLSLGFFVAFAFAPLAINSILSPASGQLDKKYIEQQNADYQSRRNCISRRRLSTLWFKDKYNKEFFIENKGVESFLIEASSCNTAYQLGKPDRDLLDISEELIKYEKGSIVRYHQSFNRFCKPVECGRISREILMKSILPNANKYNQ